MKNPLSDLTILDLTRVRSGPAAVRQFADWGANVIKIEEATIGADDRPGGSAQYADYQNTHRNKKSITLNLKSEEGLQIFYDLVKKADVVVENYRPDVKNRLKIDYESLKAVNPKIILASISGFGQTGPYAKRPGLDQIAQGLSGLMSVTGEPDQGPMRAGIPVADLTAGFFCAMGIFTALHERGRTGIGQWVESSLLQAQIYMMDFQAVRWLINKEIPGQSGNDHPISYPTGVFETEDGYINIAAMGTDMFHRLCSSLQLDDAKNDDRFDTVPNRSKNRQALKALINQKTKKYTSEALIQKLNQDGIPCGAILSLNKTFEDPQVKHLEVTTHVTTSDYGDLELLAPPFKLSNHQKYTFKPAPKAGAHNQEIYCGMLNISDTAFKELAEKKII